MLKYEKGCYDSLYFCARYKNSSDRPRFDGSAIANFNYAGISSFLTYTLIYVMKCENNGSF